jgi:hypothetical protein
MRLLTLLTKESWGLTTSSSATVLTCLKHPAFPEVVLRSCPPCVNSPCFPCDSTHGNQAGWDPAIAVANPAYRRVWTIGQGNAHSHIAWSYYWKVRVDRYGGSMSAVVCMSNIQSHVTFKRWTRVCMISIIGLSWTDVKLPNTLYM